MSLTMTTISAGDPLASQIQSLYETAFPKAERVQFDVLLNKQRPGYTSHLYAFNDDETFIGLATTIARDGLHLLGYFAIDESLRGKGYGSQAITLLKDACLPETLALEIETPDPAAPNAAERLSRQHFYFKNGFFDSEIRYSTWGVPYAVLMAGPAVSEAAYHQFYDPLVQTRE